MRVLDEYLIVARRRQRYPQQSKNTKSGYTLTLHGIRVRLHHIPKENRGLTMIHKKIRVYIEY
jgi:hypothetical protein